MIQSTHPRVLFELAFLVSSVSKRDLVGRKPRRKLFAQEGLKIADAVGEEMFCEQCHVTRQLCCGSQPFFLQKSQYGPPWGTCEKSKLDLLKSKQTFYVRWLRYVTGSRQISHSSSHFPHVKGLYYS